MMKIAIMLLNRIIPTVLFRSWTKIKKKKNTKFFWLKVITNGSILWIFMTISILHLSTVIAHSSSPMCYMLSICYRYLFLTIITAFFKGHVHNRIKILLLFPASPPPYMCASHTKFLCVDIFFYFCVQIHTNLRICWMSIYPISRCISN